MEHVIEHSEELAKRVYVSYSSVANKEVKAALGRSNKWLRPVGEPEPVPFRVKHAFEKCGYTQALHAAGRLEFREANVHPFWHTVATYEVMTNGATAPGHTTP